MSDLREEITDLFPSAVCFDEERYNKEMVDSIMKVFNKEKDNRIQELKTALLEAAALLKFNASGDDSVNIKADKYRAIAKGENNE